MTSLHDSARKVVLPVFRLTETCSKDDDGAFEVIEARQSYYVRPVNTLVEGERSDGKPSWAKHEFNLFPIVLRADCSPWPEANLFVLSCLEDSPDGDMRTYDGYAQDLAAYLKFLEEEEIKWTHFPPHKLARVTYRYRKHLNLAFEAKEIAEKTINRRLGTVIAFYRWLKKKGVFVPAYPAWIERDVYIPMKDRYGFEKKKMVTTTDLSVHVPKQDDPFDGTIFDGGKLRPLPLNEQEWLIDALAVSGNPEMTLIHLFGLLTGARLQTVCTLKVKHTELDCGIDSEEDVRLAVGHGTGVDTKGDKQMVVHIPAWFYRSIHTYANSERARKRRIKAGADDSNQYLFLTKNGCPYYSDKADRRTFDPKNQRRYDLDGGAVGTFIRTVIKPYIRETFNAKNFKFNFHDTRATFGMNMTDSLMPRVAAGEIDLSYAREFVKTRMGHESAATTDLYLNYRHTLKFVRQVIDSHEIHLKELCNKAMSGVL